MSESIRLFLYMEYTGITHIYMCVNQITIPYRIPQHHNKQIICFRGLYTNGYRGCVHQYRILPNLNRHHKLKIFYSIILLKKSSVASKALSQLLCNKKPCTSSGKTSCSKYTPSRLNDSAKSTDSLKGTFLSSSP